MNSQAVVGFLVVFCAFCVPSYLFGRFMGRRETRRGGGAGPGVYVARGKEADYAAHLDSLEDRVQQLEVAEHTRQKRENGDIPV